MVIGADAEAPTFVQAQSPVARRMWLSVLVLISVALAFVFLQENKFPAMWHPDEPNKVNGIITGKSYFNHPLLLLRSTKLLLEATAPHPNPEDIVIAGRRISAVAAALSVLMLATAAARLSGNLASLFVAVIVGSCPLLFGLAHYMKEDSIFVLGLCLFFFTVVLFDEKPSTLRLLGMSASVGLAASAKYLGIITLPIALGMVLWKWRYQRTLAPMGFVACFCGALITFFTVGVPITEFGRFRAFLGSEMVHVTTSHLNFIWPVSSPFYLVNLIKLSSPFIIASYILWLFLLYVHRERVTAAKIVIALFPIFFLVLIQISPVKIIRYELPALMLIGFGGACGLARLTRDANSRIRLLARISVAGALMFNLASIYRSWQSIAYDTRVEMAHWIEKHLPNDAVIAQEGNPAVEGGEVSHPDSGRVSARVVTNGWDRYLVSYGSPEGARRAGVTHILLQQGVFACHVDPAVSVLDEPKARLQVAEARRFYESLIREAPVVHHVEGRNPPGTFFSPALWLFCIICEPASVPRRKLDYGVPCLA
jgi:hypothetical protein